MSHIHEPRSETLFDTVPEHREQLFCFFFNVRSIMWIRGIFVIHMMMTNDLFRFCGRMRSKIRIQTSKPHVLESFSSVQFINKLFISKLTLIHSILDLLFFLGSKICFDTRQQRILSRCNRDFSCLLVCKANLHQKFRLNDRSLTISISNQIDFNNYI